MHDCKTDQLQLLIVEDSRADAAIVRRFLGKSSEMAVTTSVESTLASALSKLSEKRFDAAVVDLNLPDSSGVSTLEAMLRASPGLPVVVLTGDQHSATDALQKGAQDYIVKSELTYNSLLKAVTFAITRAQLVAALEASKGELLLQHTRLKAILETAPDAILSLDHCGTVIMVNSSTIEMFGCSELELLGAPLTQFISRSNSRHVPCSWATLSDFAGTAKQLNNLYVLSKSGASVPCDISIGRSDSSGVYDYTVVIRNTSERQELESQLKQAQKLDSIGQLASGIAHEINTPIQYIGDNTAFLQEEFNHILKLLTKHEVFFGTLLNGVYSENDLRQIAEFRQNYDFSFSVAEIPKAFEQTLDGLKKVSDIVRAMKELSHPGRCDKALVDVNHAVASAITVARNEWKYVARIETELAPDLPHAMCFPGDINQVVLNLVTNAAHAIGDYIKKHGKEMGTITIRTRVENENLVLEVQDNGGGIPLAIKNKVFDPFFTTKPAGKGTGQGLALCNSIVVERHGGSIELETEDGVGTTFRVRIPVTDAQNFPGEALKAESKRSGQQTTCS